MQVYDVTYDVTALAIEIINQGATRAKVIGISEVMLDPRVRLKCQVPRCNSYDHNLQCPPHCITVGEFREYLSCYHRAIFIQQEGILPADDHLDLKAVFEPANKLHSLVNWAEARAFALDYRFATGFIGGCCKLCPECVGPGQKCSYPFQARPSMEAMGVDVVATSRKVGMPIVFPATEKVVWCGLLLLD